METNKAMKLLILLISAALLPLLTAHSEELTLSLDQAFALAEKHDLTLTAARLEVETGDAQVREAISAALPNISFSSTLMRNMIVPTMYFEPIGRVPVGTANDITSEISLQQPIWLAGKVGMALKAARTYRQIARNMLSANRAKLKSDVVKEYFGLALMQEVVRVTGEAVAQAERHAETVKRMYEVGMASEFDLLRAQVEFKSLEPQIASALKNADLARISFCNRLGINPFQQITLTDKLSTDTKSVVPLGVDEAYNSARETRPEFTVFGLRESLDKISVKAEKRNLYWPNFVFGLSYRRQFQENKLDRMRDAYWPESFTWVLSMSIPLFDGFATPAKIQKAKIGLRRTQLEQTQLEQGIRLEVSLALNELKRAQDQVNSLESALELAEKVLDIGQTRYEQGIGTELEVLDTQLALQRAQLGYLQGLYDLRVANAEYARIVENDTDFGGEKQ